MMIFTPVSHYKFMVIPFVYADKALYSVRFFHERVTKYLTHRRTSRSGCINFFYFSFNQPSASIAQTIALFENVDCPNCVKEKSWSFYRNSHSMLDDKARFRERLHCYLDDYLRDLQCTNFVRHSWVATYASTHLFRISLHKSEFSGRNGTFSGSSRAGSGTYTGKRAVSR